jgi:heterodisulfide reductase subunit A
MGIRGLNMEEPRIGVFICNCGTNIGAVINVKKLTEYVSTLQNVAFTDEGRFICSADYLNKIKEAISKNRLNRVVVACCTPRTHEAIFRSALREAGLNPYLLEFVSIREQASWVHKDNPEAAFEKAKELIRMGIAKALLLEPSEEVKLPVGREALIIGGGISGITAALSLASLGIEVYLVEKEAELGGLLRRLIRIAPANISSDELLMEKISQLSKYRNIHVFTNTEIEDINGYIGNFNIKIRTGSELRELKVSTITVSTGMEERKPKGLYGYGEFSNVVTALEFEEKVKNGEISLDNLGSVAIINCVGSKTNGAGCCNIGCMVSIKNAEYIKERNPNIKVYVLHQDLNMRGVYECYFRKVMDKYDVNLLRYDGRLEVSRKDNGLKVKVYDVLLGDYVELNVDLIILISSLQGSQSVNKLKGYLKASIDTSLFLKEAHVKLKPLDLLTDGVYVCGGARSPKSVDEAMKEALGAAMRAAIPMVKGFVINEGIMAEIDHKKCAKCYLCVKTCPFNAIEIVNEYPVVVKGLCKGCGTCAAECPRDAIDIVGFRKEQIMRQIEEALRDKPEEKILAFCCHWCALGAIDLAGVSRFQYPPNIRIIRVMCSGRVDVDFIHKAFELGARGVLVAGCEFPTCHYVNGNYKCRDRMEKVRRQLISKGIDPDRLRTVWLSAADAPKFVSTVKNMVEELGISHD